MCVYVSLTRKELTFLTVAESRMNVCVKREYKEKRMQEKNQCMEKREKNNELKLKKSFIKQINLY